MTFMEQILDKPIIGKSIAQVTTETLKYIDDRRKHNIISLKTRWNKFNQVCFFEPNMIYTIAGISGSGKSAFANTIANDLIDLNPSQEIVVLNFSFEMVSYRNVGRTLSNKLRMTTNELYSSNTDVDDTKYEEIEKTAKVLEKYNIYYIDTPMDVSKIEETIHYYHDTIAKDKWLIIILDHTLLVEGDSERGTLIDLQKMFIRVKKLSKTCILQISQMNRNIETPERINNPVTHFPMRSDLAASDAIFQASDYVLAIHRPETLQLQFYGVNRLPVKNKVYLHLLKVREGEPCILMFENELKYGNLVETTSESSQPKVVFNNKKG
mgnify:CR=1 FL=1